MFAGAVFDSQILRIRILFEDITTETSILDKIL